MTVIARDQVASDHLVYAWPFPIGPECEVSCADDEQVVMCPAWMVGDRLGPGHHRWRTPDPTRPVGAFFVLTAPVEVSFDMVTSFMVPSNGMPVRLRASGSLQVRCADPGLLIAQFVGLPFDHVNEGVMRSVSRSVERMLARLLTRRVVMSGTPIAVTDAGMLPGIVEELIAYNPTAGAVFGVELIRMGHLVIAADDGSTPYLALPARNVDWSGSVPRIPPEHTNGNGNGHAHHHVEQPLAAAPPGSPNQYARPKTPQMSETIRGMPAVSPPEATNPAEDPKLAAASGEIVVRAKGSQPPTQPASQPAQLPSEVSGEIRPKTPSSTPTPPPPAVAATPPPTPTPPVSPQIPVAGEIRPRVTPLQPPPASTESTTPRNSPKTLPPPLPPLPRRAPAVEVPQSADEITHPGIDAKVMTPVPGSMRAPTPTPNPAEAEARGSIMGIGVAAIGHSAVAGEIPTKVPPGGRVLVPGPNGLMQSATVRQLLQGYYELEVGSSGETIWVPIAGVVPES